MVDAWIDRGFGQGLSNVLYNDTLNHGSDTIDEETIPPSGSFHQADNFAQIP